MVFDNLLEDHRLEVGDVMESLYACRPCFSSWKRVLNYQINIDLKDGRRVVQSTLSFIHVMCSSRVKATTIRRRKDDSGKLEELFTSTLFAFHGLSVLFRLLLSASFLVVAMIFSLVIFCHFLSHAYQINFFAREDGGELISFTTWPMAVARCRCLLPEHVYTCEGYSNRIYSCVCVCLSVCVSPLNS